MSIREILLHMDGGERDAVRFELAANLAERFDAHLVGLHVVNPYVTVAMGGPGAVGIAELQRQYMDAMHVRAATVKQQFSDWTDRRSTSSEWRFIEGDVRDTVAIHARYTDLAVIGQGAQDDASATLPEELCAEVALGAGVPVLAVPYAGTFPSIGKRVLVAWNGSRESTRAVHDALPLLVSAEAVVILSVEAEEPNVLPGADIAGHLARHGVEVEVKRVSGADTSVSDTLLNMAADLSVDMIVMGAYGHSRFREFVLGGVTHQILGMMTVPVLLAH